MTVPPSRILIVQDCLRSGGTERQSIHLAREFRACGHAASLLTFRPGGTLAATSGSGVTVVSGSGTAALVLSGTAAALNAFVDDPTQVRYSGADGQLLRVRVEDAERPARYSESVIQLVGTGASAALVSPPAIAALPTTVWITPGVSSALGFAAADFERGAASNIRIRIATDNGTPIAFKGLTATNGVHAVGSGSTSTTLAEATLTGTEAELEAYLKAADNLRYTGAATALKLDLLYEVAGIWTVASSAKIALAGPPAVTETSTFGGELTVPRELFATPGALVPLRLGSNAIVGDGTLSLDVVAPLAKLTLPALGQGA